MGTALETVFIVFVTTVNLDFHIRLKLSRATGSDFQSRPNTDALLTELSPISHGPMDHYHNDNCHYGAPIAQMPIAGTILEEILGAINCPIMPIA